MRRVWKRRLLWPIAATVVVAMFGMLLSWGVTPLGQHYFADPSQRTPILPAFAAPRSGGGWLPPPGPPSAAYIRAALAKAGRQPGDRSFPTSWRANGWAPRGSTQAWVAPVNGS
jgi:hypothetical protein